jgi:hypothetical protein
MRNALYTPATTKYTPGTINCLLGGYGRRGTFKASVEDVARALGRSHMPQFDSKVSIEYVFIDNQSKTLVSLYSYKGSAEKHGEWSISGPAHPVAFEIWLKRQVSNYRRRARRLMPTAA